jgi:hypothetical protein
LAASSAASGGSYCSGTEEELTELLLWLKREELQEMSRTVIAEMHAPLDEDKLSLLQNKLIEINKELQTLE